MASFTAAEQKTNAILVKPGQSASYTVTVADLETFDGVVRFEKSPYPDQGFSVIVDDATATGTNNGSYENQTKQEEYVRCRCLSIEGGSDAIVAEVSIPSGQAVSGLQLVGNKVVGVDGSVLATFTDTGVSFPGDVAVADDLDVVGTASANGGALVTDLLVSGDIEGPRNVKTKTVAIASFTVGATHTLTNAIPAGSLVVGFSTFVETAVAGPVTIDIGDGVDADGFVVDQLPAEDTAVVGGGALIPKLFAAANNVVLTAVGGNFTGVGEMSVYIHYISVTDPVA